jgi:prefoldin subunit 5
MAPKDSAPEPELDDHVKRCRGQLIKVCTEGGNKGISTVVGYQRRAFLHNGVIQLCDDFVAHKPGTEDIGRTADALRCSEDALAALETGEILARGESITGGDLAGPTRVRKRSSPDPREDSFELPDTPAELSDVLGEIQAEVEAERERREQRADELEQLRAENERLQERVDELEQELADSDRLASALENLGGGSSAAADVGEGVEGLQDRVDELKAERDDLEATLGEQRGRVSDLEAEREQLQERVADLEADRQELRTAFDAAGEHLTELADQFGVAVAVDGPASDESESGESGDAVLQERIADLEAENERLREQAAGEGTVSIEPLDSYEAFLEDDDVRTVIEEAKNEDYPSQKYHKGVLASILQTSGPVSYEEVKERLGVSRTNEISSAATTLAEFGVVEKEKRDGGTFVDLNIGGLQEIREKAEARRRTTALMDDL